LDREHLLSRILWRMRCPRHDLAMASDGKCVRCRREEEAAADAVAAKGNGPRVAIVAVGALIVAGGLAWSLRPRAAAQIPVARPAPYVAPSAPPLASLDPATVAPDPTAAPASSARSPLERAMHKANITFYSRPASTDCGLARTWLLSHGYLFRERDIDADRDARAAWQRTVPGGTVPAFDIDGQAFGGYDPARIQAALEYAGARRLQP
jgi:glutaredoxin